MSNPGNWSKNWSFRVYYCASKTVFWIAATSSNARILALVFTDSGDRKCYMTRARRIHTVGYMQGKRLSCSHHWPLSLITSEHARDSWALAVTPMGVWDVSSQLHIGLDTHLFSEPPSLNNYGRMGGAWWEWRWKRGVMSGSGDRWVGGGVL